MTENNGRQDDFVSRMQLIDTLDATGRKHAAARETTAAAQAWTQCAETLRDVVLALTLRQTEVLERAAAATAQSGHPDRALALAHQAAALLRDARAADRLSEPEFAVRLGNVGMLLCAMQRWDDAARVLTETDAAFAASTEVTAELRRRRVATSAALATAHRFSGQQSDALLVLERAVADAEAIVAATGAPSDRFELSDLHNMQGQILLETGQPDLAMPKLRRCVASIRELAGATRDPQPRNLLAAALNRLGHVHAKLGNRGEACECLTESVALMRKLVQQDGLTGLADDLRTAQRDLATFGG